MTTDHPPLSLQPPENFALVAYCVDTLCETARSREEIESGLRSAACTFASSLSSAHDFCRTLGILIRANLPSTTTLLDRTFLGVEMGDRRGAWAAQEFLVSLGSADRSADLSYAALADPRPSASPEEIASRVFDVEAAWDAISNAAVDPDQPWTDEYAPSRPGQQFMTYLFRTITAVCEDRAIA